MKNIKPFKDSLCLYYIRILKGHEYMEDKIMKKNQLSKLSAVLICTTLSAFAIFTNTNASQTKDQSKMVSNLELTTYSDEIKSGVCGTDVYWKLENGILTISGNGQMQMFNYPWENYKGQIQEIYIEDGVTSISDMAFSDCYHLKKVVIGNSVKTIGASAFMNDKYLEELTLGNSVETIEMNALYGISITKLTLPATIKNLVPNSLVAIPNLKDIEIAANDTYESVDGVLYSNGGKTLFLYPSGRKGTYMIPSNVTKIEEQAFAYTDLSKIVVPDTVKELGDGAFEFATNLETIVFGNGITTIPRNCCYNNNKLVSVSIAEGITTIKKSSFWCCSSLKEITLPKTVTQIEEAFDDSTEVTTLNKDLIRVEDGSYVKGYYVNVKAKELYDKAFKALDYVNEERKKEGLPELVMDQELLETAMQRDFESAILWSHTRPNGTSCFSINDRVMGENMASWYGSPEEVVKAWMQSEGHRANILGENFKSIGIGCIHIDGSYYWVQCFGTDIKTEVSASSYTDQVNDRNVLVECYKPYYKAELEISKDHLQIGETTEIKVLWNGNELTDSGVILESSDPSICEIKNQTITAKRSGVVNITMYFNGYKEMAQKKQVIVNAPTTTTASTEASTTTTAVNNTVDAYKTKIKVSRASIKSLKNKKSRKVTVKLNKVRGAKGYQIVYSTKKNFKKSSKLKTSKTTFTISKLKKKQTYYMKVRAYQLDAKGKVVYGNYGVTKKIKILF